LKNSTEVAEYRVVLAKHLCHRISNRNLEDLGFNLFGLLTNSGVLALIRCHSRLRHPQLHHSSKSSRVLSSTAF